MITIIGGMSRNIPDNIFKPGTYKQIDVDQANSFPLPNGTSLILLFKKFISHGAYNRFKEMATNLDIPFVAAKGGVRSLIEAAKERGIDMSEYLVENTLPEEKEEEIADVIPMWASKKLKGSNIVCKVNGHPVYGMAHKYGKTILFRGILMSEAIKRVKELVPNLNRKSITSEIVQLVIEDVAKVYNLPTNEYQLPSEKSVRETIFEILELPSIRKTKPKNIERLAIVDSISIYGRHDKKGMYDIILEGDEGKSIRDEMIRYAIQNNWDAISKNNASRIASYLNIKLGISVMKDVKQISRYAIINALSDVDLKQKQINNIPTPIVEVKTEPANVILPPAIPHVVAKEEIEEVKCDKCDAMGKEIERLNSIIKNLQMTVNSLMSVVSLGK